MMPNHHKRRATTSEGVEYPPSVACARVWRASATLADEAASRDIDFDRKRVQVREGKGSKTRIVPIIDEEFLSDLTHPIASKKPL